MADFVSIFKALSDINRLRIMILLLRSGKEICICEIVDAVDIAQYNVSRCVKELRGAELIEERREGRFMFYSVIPPRTEPLKRLFKTLGSLKGDIFTEDYDRLKKRLALRKCGKCVIGIRGGEKP